MTEAKSIVVAAVVAGLVSVGVALLTIIAAGWWGTVDAKRAVSVQFVTIAVDVLRSVPEDATMPLREWAIEVINEHSQVELGPSARKLLLTTPWDVSPSRKFGEDGEDFGQPYASDEPDNPILPYSVPSIDPNTIR